MYSWYSPDSEAYFVCMLGTTTSTLYSEYVRTRFTGKDLMENRKSGHMGLGLMAFTVQKLSAIPE
jgi:hypothetical protein